MFYFYVYYYYSFTNIKVLDQISPLPFTLLRYKSRIKPPPNSSCYTLPKLDPTSPGHTVIRIIAPPLHYLFNFQIRKLCKRKKTTQKRSKILIFISFLFHFTFFHQLKIQFQRFPIESSYFIIILKEKNLKRKNI